MAFHVEDKIRVNIPAKTVWEVLGDFSSIERFSTAVEKSPILDGISSGLGTKRKCDFYDGSSVIEEIIDYQEGKCFKIEVTEYSMPLKSLYAEMKVEEVDANASEISMSMEFVVKGGPFQWLMGFFMMRPMMKGIIKETLTGLAYNSATGKPVGNKLPAKEDLSLVFNG